MTREEATKALASLWFNSILTGKNPPSIVDTLLASGGCLAPGRCGVHFRDETFICHSCRAARKAR